MSSRLGNGRRVTRLAACLIPIMLNIGACLGVIGNGNSCRWHIEPRDPLNIFLNFFAEYQAGAQIYRSNANATHHGSHALDVPFRDIAVK